VIKRCQACALGWSIAVSQPGADRQEEGWRYPDEEEPTESNQHSYRSRRQEAPGKRRSTQHQDRTGDREQGDDEQGRKPSVTPQLASKHGRDNWDREPQTDETTQST
jgi:hypothetical protein